MNQTRTHLVQAMTICIKICPKRIHNCIRFQVQHLLFSMTLLSVCSNGTVGQYNTTLGVLMFPVDRTYVLYDFTRSQIVFPNSHIRTIFDSTAKFISSPMCRLTVCV